MVAAIVVPVIESPVSISVIGTRIVVAITGANIAVAIISSGIVIAIEGASIIVAARSIRIIVPVEGTRIARRAIERADISRPRIVIANIGLTTENSSSNFGLTFPGQTWCACCHCKAQQYKCD
jgi:hypothetical protein